MGGHHFSARHGADGGAFLTAITEKPNHAARQRQDVFGIISAENKSRVKINVSFVRKHYEKSLHCPSARPFMKVDLTCKSELLSKAWMLVS